MFQAAANPSSLTKKNKQWTLLSTPVIHRTSSLSNSARSPSLPSPRNHWCRQIHPPDLNLLPERPPLNKTHIISAGEFFVRPAPPTRLLDVFSQNRCATSHEPRAACRVSCVGQASLSRPDATVSTGQGSVWMLSTTLRG